MPTGKALWDDQSLRDPHTAPDKPARVRGMFTAIAPTYDLNNRLHSLGLDQHWRKLAVRMAQVKPGDTVVDVACGTGDLSMQMAVAGAAKVIGIDFTYAMLPLAHAKARRQGQAMTWLCGDAMRLPLADACADVVCIAFGIRNVADPAAAIGEFARVLRPGGRLVILEFSLPRNRLLRGLYGFYFRHILPRSAAWISGDRTGAYRYLPQSVSTFLSSEQMLSLLQARGFDNTRCRSLSLGVCACYVGTRK
jgi:demethylmenaquinone methyltransferase/2-methoxy-6-polyprenyl-1,4-benzoquinol methylase